MRFKLTITLILLTFFSFAEKPDSLFFDGQIKRMYQFKQQISDSTLIVAIEVKAEVAKYPEFSYVLNRIKPIEANYYYRIGDYKTALLKYNEIGKAGHLAKDSAMLALAYYSEGNVYQYIDMYKESIPLFIESIKYSLPTTPIKNVAQKYRNLAESYFFIEKYDSAIPYLDTVIAYAKKNNDTAYLLISQTFKSHAYIKLFDKTNDVKLLESAQILVDSSKRVIGNLGYSNLNLVAAKLAFLKQDYQKVITELDLAWKEELNTRLSFKSLYPEMSELYYKTYNLLGKFDQSMYFMGINQSYLDSMEFLDSKRLTQKYNLETDFKNEQLSNEIKQTTEIKQERIKYSAYLAKQRIYFIAGLIAIIAIIIVAFIVIRRSKKLKALYKQLREKTKDLRDSINYAKRIQDTILPSEKKMEVSFSEHMVYYQPKDIVAGDFYWLKLKQDNIYFAVADCTGHGVPGALVSLICHEALEKSVFLYHKEGLGKVMDSVRELVVRKLNAKGYEEVKDGMDIAVCKVDPEKNSLEFVGANNPLWLIRNKEIIQIRGDRQPVGLYDKIKPFTAHTIPLEKGDLIYLSSDGYPDQFGGELGKKFKSSQLKKLLLNISDKGLQDQKVELERQFGTWKAGFEQLDDVCIMGVRV